MTRRRAHFYAKATLVEANLLYPFFTTTLSCLLSIGERYLVQISNCPKCTSAKVHLDNLPMSLVVCLLVYIFLDNKSLGIVNVIH